MDSTAYSQALGPSILPETVPCWLFEPFFRQESQEKWLLLLRGMPFICNATTYEVLRRIDGTVSVEGLLREVQGALPGLTFEDVCRLLHPLVALEVLGFATRRQMERCERNGQ